MTWPPLAWQQFSTACLGSSIICSGADFIALSIRNTDIVAEWWGHPKVSDFSAFYSDSLRKFLKICAALIRIFIEQLVKSPIRKSKASALFLNIHILGCMPGDIFLLPFSVPPVKISSESNPKTYVSFIKSSKRSSISLATCWSRQITNKVQHQQPFKKIHSSLFCIYNIC